MKRKLDTSAEALAEDLLGRPYDELEEDEQRVLHRVASTEIELVSSLNRRVHASRPLTAFSLMIRSSGSLSRCGR